MSYHSYLKSYAWSVKRTAALKRADHRCQVCYSPDNLEVHHRTYDNIYDERPGDLTVLCHECHRLFSNRMAKRPYKFLERLGFDIREGDR